MFSHTMPKELWNISDKIICCYPKANYQKIKALEDNSYTIVILKRILPMSKSNASGYVLEIEGQLSKNGEFNITQLDPAYCLPKQDFNIQTLKVLYGQKL